MKKIDEILAVIDEKPWMGKIWRTPQIKEAIRLAQLEVISEIEQNMNDYALPGEGVVWVRENAFEELRSRIKEDV